jgi:hypothetical protein
MGERANDTDTLARTLDRICRDPKARRELLWIRAKSKEDEVAARSLLAVDPGIRRRLAREHDLERIDELRGRERREAFEALWDEHYARLEARIGAGRSERAPALPIAPERLLALFDMLHRERAAERCDNTCRMTERWLDESRLPAAKVLSWLRQRGGYCDCEVVLNVEPRVRHVLEEHRSYDYDGA